MFENLSQKLDNQNENLKNISKSFETVSFIIKNTQDKNSFNDLKNILTDLKPILANLETEITDLENLLSTSIPVSNEEHIYDENTLLISEIQNKVVLPYTIADLQKILDTNKEYTSFEKIIDDLYTIPIDNYKNYSKSRFKEAFNLMRKREKASFAESLSLAIEASFNASLNPAIITACKNLDELDTYLDCLSENELHKFNLFNIKYEMLPHK